MTVDAEFKSKNPENTKKTENKHQIFKLVVSEGSIVVLEARDLIKNIDDNSDTHYSWNYTDHMPIANDNLVKDNSSFLFTAPYVKGYDPYISLGIELTIKDNNGKTSNPYYANVIVKRVHRAIIFQGGVALGAYEAGVF